MLIETPSKALPTTRKEKSKFGIKFKLPETIVLEENTPHAGYGKCTVDFCGCGQYLEKPGYSGWCKCGHSYDDHY